MVPKALSSYFSLPDDVCWTDIGSGHMNQSWIGSVDSEPTIVLRISTQFRTVCEIRQEMALLEELYGKTRGLVAPGLPGQDSELVQRIDGDYYSLFPFRSGTLMSMWEPEQVKPAAEALAILHAAAFDMVGLKGFKDARPPFTASAIQLPDGLRRQIIDSPLAGKFIALGLTVEALDEAIISARTIWEEPTIETAVRIPIHGDYGPINILWAPEDRVVTTVLDWDESRWDLPVFDLASAVQFFADPTDGSRFSERFMNSYLNRLDEYSHILANEVDRILPMMDRIRQAVSVRELLFDLEHSIQVDGEIETDLIKMFVDGAIS
ncbi:MAG: phosphotransferase [SAR202 cluster bacterium]|nr:phosphotransferase [SAR202 cluster bacterium]MDP6514516.1 phosphotransferase [SAR202 cluster bacterium]MDP6713785.1 phosphotransferase [SAR202 cluster bacterium]